MKPVKVENARYEEYEELLLERDCLLKESRQIWTVYVKTFGQLMTEVFEEKIACIRQKKLIGYYQTAINRGQPIDAEALEGQLDREMTEYQKELHRLIMETERCREAGTSTRYEVERSKVLYRRLAKLLHPDIHPETDRNKTLLELWTRIVEAYGKNDVKALSELEVLARKALKELQIDGVTTVEIPDLEDKIREIQQEIEKIRNTEPYTFRSLLEDENAVDRKRQELQKELETWKKYHQELLEVTEQLLRDGGVQIIWRMN